MLPAGDAFVAMHAGTVSIIASENTPLAGWALCVSGGGVPAFLSELGFSNKNVFVSIFNNQLINKMLDQCFQLCEHIRNASDVSTVSYYIKGCYASLCTVGVLRGNSEHIQSSAISRIINLMRSRITGTLSIAEMATAYGCSCSRFLSVYRRHMGVSPGQHFLQMKIRYAAQLLLTTALPLIEIAHRVGYDDYRYFTRIFKTRMHTTPHSFRKAHT